MSDDHNGKPSAALLETMQFIATNSVNISKPFRLRDGAYISSVRLSTARGSFDGHGDGVTPVHALMLSIANAREKDGAK